MSVEKWPDFFGQRSRTGTNFVPFRLVWVTVAYKFASESFFSLAFASILLVLLMVAISLSVRFCKGSLNLRAFNSFQGLFNIVQARPQIIRWIEHILIEKWPFLVSKFFDLVSRLIPSESTFSPDWPGPVTKTHSGCWDLRVPWENYHRKEYSHLNPTHRKRDR